MVWALAFGAGAVAQVLFSKNRLKLGVEYFGFAGAAIFEETVLVFQRRDTCRFLALAVDIRQNFVWVGVEVFADYFFQVTSVRLFDIKLPFCP